MEKMKFSPFYRQIFKLVVPIVLQNLLSAAVSSADVVMLNFVGQSAISAVSLASQYASVLFMVFYGLGTGASMLCAQGHCPAVLPDHLGTVRPPRPDHSGIHDAGFYQ